MQHRTTTATTVAAILLAGALGLVLGACGDSSPDAPAPGVGGTAGADGPTAEDEAALDAEIAFCQATDGIRDSASIDLTDDAAMAAQLGALSEELAAVTPPEELAADWAAVISVYGTLADAARAEAADPAADPAPAVDPAVANTQDLTAQAIAVVSDEAFRNSALNIGIYATTHCS